MLLIPRSIGAGNPMDISRLALMAYEAASEPELWTQFLKHYAEAVSADAALLQIHDLGRRTSTILSIVGLSTQFTASYNEYYGKLNVWRERGDSLYVPGRVITDEVICPRRELVRSEFYNDYLLRVGATRTMAAVISRDSDRIPTLSILRDESKPSLGDEECNIARQLLPHLRARGVFLSGLNY